MEDAERQEAQDDAPSVQTEAAEADISQDESKVEGGAEDDADADVDENSDGEEEEMAECLKASGALQFYIYCDGLLHLVDTDCGFPFLSLKSAVDAAYAKVADLPESERSAAVQPYAYKLEVWDINVEDEDREAPTRC